jgi:hypothetical protein
VSDSALNCVLTRVTCAIAGFANLAECVLKKGLEAYQPRNQQRGCVITVLQDLDVTHLYTRSLFCHLFHPRDQSVYSFRCQPDSAGVAQFSTHEANQSTTSCGGQIVKGLPSLWLPRLLQGHSALILAYKIWFGGL